MEINKTKLELQRRLYIMQGLAIGFIILFATMFIIHVIFVNKNKELQESYPNLEWRNFVVVGDNIKIYVDEEILVDLDGLYKSFSWWMRTASGVRNLAIWNVTLTSESAKEFYYQVEKELEDKSK